jgi:hypothetical protein
MTLVFEDSFSRLLVNFLRCFETLPSDGNILFERFLSFLLERVEYIDTLSKFGYVDYPKSAAGLYADFIHARS